MVVRVLQGHVLDVLPTLPAESVHVCVTSPPYWGLRAYGTEPQIWSGDPECEHVWGDELSIQTKGLHPGPKATVRNTIAGVCPAIRQQGAFCQCCGAWRGEWGTEPTPQLYVEHSVAVFREVWRVMRKDATLWVNLGDSYAGSVNGWSAAKTKAAGKDDRTFRDKPFSTVAGGLKPKDLCMVPARFALAMQEAGWWLRSDIAWCKRSPMPESVTDRPTSAWEHIFLFSKGERYFYDQDAVRQPLTGNSAEWRLRNGRVGGEHNGPKHAVKVENGLHGDGGFENGLNPAGRNLWNYWTLSPDPFPDAHFATFPTEIPERAIKAGTSEKGACAECGAPWRRVTEKEWVSHGWTGGQKRADTPGAEVSPSSVFRTGGTNVAQTTGWEPTCKHTHGERVPCEVLDICGGSGTTGMVADRLGRNCTLIELNPTYAAMSRRRIVGDSPMFAEVELTRQGLEAPLGAEGPVPREGQAPENQEGERARVVLGKPRDTRLQLPLEEVRA